MCATMSRSSNLPWPDYPRNIWCNPDGRMIMNGECYMMCNEAVLACFKVLFRHLIEGPGGNHKNLDQDNQYESQKSNPETF
jgi:hypothetical protein